MDDPKPSTNANGGTPSTPDADTIKMFVGQIPRSWTEVQCRELFETYGPVYQLNILRDKQSQSSKGCCFVTYYHRKDAISAQSDLHNVKILSGMHHPIQMKPADSENRNERKLFIGMIDKSMKEEKVREMFAKFGSIEDCSVLRDADGRSKGCAFVTFGSRANAQTAIKHMHHSQTMEGCGNKLVVKFADTQRDRDTKKPSAGNPPSTSPVGVQPIIQPGVGNLLAVLQSALLQQNPQMNQQHNMLSLLGNVLTGLGRLTEVQQQSIGPTTVSLSTHSSLAPSGAPVLSASSAGGAAITSGDSSAALAYNPLLQQQQQAAVIQQHRLLELALLQQQSALGLSAASQQAYSNESLMQQQQQQQQNALVTQSLLQQQQMAGVGASPLMAAASPKEASLFQQQQQLVQQLSAVGALGGLTNGASAYENYLQNSALSMAGLMPSVNLSNGQTSGLPAVSAANGNGQSKGPDGCNLFIYHLPQDYTDSDLYNTFIPFGTVLSAKVFIDKQTNLSKCFGFVSYDNAASAANAISGMNGFAIGSKRLKVQLKNSRGGGTHPYAPPNGCPSAISI